MKLLKEAGYRIKDACKALGISRSGFYATGKPKGLKEAESGGGDEELIEKIKTIKLEHPFWGYRRVWAWIRFREKVTINQKKVRRIMKENGLMAHQDGS